MIGRAIRRLVPQGGAGSNWRRVTELACFAALFAALYGTFVAVDAFDTLHGFTRAHEAWELDELLIAGLCLGICGALFALRRWRAEHEHLKEVQKLKAKLESSLARAEASDRAKSSFLANLSHELRTPLNAVIGYAQIMESGMMGPLDARYAAYAKDIRDSGEHLLEVLNDILDISQADANRMQLRPAETNLKEITDRCFKLVAGRAQCGGIALDNAVPDDLGGISADQQRLKQILINLVGNAVKFSPAGAAVTVTARRHRGGVTIEVRDHGIGMTAEDANRVLQPFVQAEPAQSRKYGGVGLGLPLVQRLVNLHGGRFELRSELGQGTTAAVTLPQADLQVAEAPTPAADAIARHARQPDLNAVLL